MSWDPVYPPLRGPSHKRTVDNRYFSHSSDPTWRRPVQEGHISSSNVTGEARKNQQYVTPFPPPSLNRSLNDDGSHQDDQGGRACGNGPGPGHVRDNNRYQPYPRPPGPGDSRFRGPTPDFRDVPLPPFIQRGPPVPTPAWGAPGPRFNGGGPRMDGPPPFDPAAHQHSHDGPGPHSSIAPGQSFIGGGPGPSGESVPLRAEPAPSGSSLGSTPTPYIPMDDDDYDFDTPDPLAAQPKRKKGPSTNYVYKGDLHKPPDHSEPLEEGEYRSKIRKKRHPEKLKMIYMNQLVQSKQRIEQLEKERDNLPSDGLTPELEGTGFDPMKYRHELNAKIKNIRKLNVSIEQKLQELIERYFS